MHKKSSCIIHPNKPSRSGYVRLTICRNGNRHYEYAHRMAYVRDVGPIPKGMHVLHRCDVRNCVNTEHLFIGTHADNMRDMARKGRASKHDRSGIRNGHVKLTEEEVRKIRVLISLGLTQTELSDLFQVARSSIYRISSGLGWKNVA